MPSVGRIKQLSVLGVATAAVLGFSASSASAADDVWLWACHSPNGGGLALDTLKSNGDYQENTAYDGQVSDLGDTCTANANGGKTLRLGAPGAPGAVRGQSSASMLFDVPSGLKLAQVKVLRETTGLAGNTNGQGYSATVGSTSLESSAGANFTGELDKTVSANPGDQLRIGVSCSASASQSCAATSDTSPVSASVTRVGMKVSEVGDNTAPSFAVGGIRNPAAGKLALDIRATDAGVGLKMVEAWWENEPGAAKTATFGGTDCAELTPGDATVDLPLDADCTKVTSPNGVPLEVDAGPLSNADHTLVVRVWDWAGNFTEQKQVLTVLNNPDLGTATRTLSIGTSGINVPNPQGSTNNGSGGVAGASATSCNSPRLSMVLAEKPLRIKKRVPVLKYNKRYKFTGRLTCVINGKRRSAPKRTRIDILSTIGKKTTEGPGTTTAGSGKISVILAYTKSRTLIFRFTNADGKRSQVRIKVTVARK